MSVHAAVLATVCANCGAELGGAFCQACGQKTTGPDVSLHDFFHDALHEFAHVDGKIIQTVRLLVTKPGMLTKEFLSGRRARFISPLRVYLTCSVLFFGLVALAPNPQLSFFHVTYKPSPGDAPLDAAAIQRYEDEATLRASRGVVHDFPRAMFALMPVFGLLTWVLYRRARPFYAAHLYYSIHFHAFVFLALTLEVALILLAGRQIPAVTWLAPVAILAYHFISLRRVFGGSRLATAWKGTLLWIVYLFVIVSTMIAIGLVSVRGTGPGKTQSEITGPHS
jgi:hypothetical protein